MPLAVEDLLLRQRARDEPLGKILDLLGGHLAGVVFVEAVDVGAAQVEGERMHVAQVQHQLLLCRGNLGILERAQRGGRPGVEEDDGRSPIGAGQHRAGAGEVLGQLLRQVGEGEQVVLPLDDAA